jgi:diguanylate cyclase (GGDEF)-like protein
VRDLTQRLRVQGTITYYQPGFGVVLQNGPRSLWISTKASGPLQIGDLADATGFPETHDGLLTLNHAEIQDSQVQAPITPQPATWRQLAFWGRSVLGGHQDDLVSINGRVVSEVREAAQDEYVLIADGRLFTAIYRHPPVPRQLPKMLQAPLDATVRVTGICIAVDTDPFNDEAPFNILLRSFDDIAVIADPPWLSIRNLMRALIAMFLVVIAAVIWGAILNRKVHRQTAALSARIAAEAAMERRSAQLEQRRSFILEAINGTRSLASILEEIAELSSLWLDGAPCWCEVAEGTVLGRCPPEPHALRIVRKEIPARAGSSLGVLLAGFEAGSHPASQEDEALLVGARLATLAIESRRLYTDLVHRSDYDLLTDIRNRFSLEKQLDAQVAESMVSGGIFGLIYIDLDDFKLINDRLGHQTGDQYLQQAALRMTQQVRSIDMLARLGGDEFAVLVPYIRTRADVEEIALRLMRAFDEPFVIGSLTVPGSASVGVAIYPEDGNSKDSLLHAADAAMYQAKNARRAVLRMVAAEGSG